MSRRGADGLFLTEERKPRKTLTHLVIRNEIDLSLLADGFEAHTTAHLIPDGYSPQKTPRLSDCTGTVI